jgi:predicted component of type VI protein secretion system
MATGFILQTKDGSAYAVSGSTRLGRGYDCDIVLSDDRVSRHHATAWVEGGRLHLRDENASNGTFVNGRRLKSGQAVALNPGDQIQIGAAYLTAAVGAATARPRAPAPPGIGAQAPTTRMEAVQQPAGRPNWLPIAIGCGLLLLLMGCAAILVVSYYSGLFR